MVSKLSQSCLEVVPKVSQICFQVVPIGAQLLFMFSPIDAPTSVVHNPCSFQVKPSSAQVVSAVHLVGWVSNWTERLHIAVWRSFIALLHELEKHWQIALPLFNKVCCLWHAFEIDLQYTARKLVRWWSVLLPSWKMRMECFDSPLSGQITSISLTLMQLVNNRFNLWWLSEQGIRWK